MAVQRTAPFPADFIISDSRIFRVDLSDLSLFCENAKQNKTKQNAKHALHFHAPPHGHPKTHSSCPAFVKQVVHRFDTASLISGLLLLVSGLSQTGPAGCQLRVFSDSRSGFCARTLAWRLAWFLSVARSWPAWCASGVMKRMALWRCSLLYQLVKDFTVNRHSTVTQYQRPNMTHPQEGGTGWEVSKILFFSAKSKRPPSLIYSMQIIPVCLSIVAR